MCFDYGRVDQFVLGAARAGMLGVTIVTLAGLAKLNFDGPGLTESVKSLWRSPKSE